MKKMLMLALFLSSGLALADNKCIAECKDMADDCTAACSKSLKKKNPAAMPQCANQCKMMTAECEKECANESPKKR